MTASFRETDQVLFRYSLTNDAQHGVATGFGNIGSQVAPSGAYDTAIHDQAWVFGENHVLSSHAVNEFRFQFVRNIFNLDSVDPYGPRINVDGIGSFGRDFNVPSDRTQHRYQWLDNYSHTIGRHNLKVGGDFNRISFDTKTAVFVGGAMEFSQLPVPPAALFGITADNTTGQFALDPYNYRRIEPTRPRSRLSPPNR